VEHASRWLVKNDILDVECTIIPRGYVQQISVRVTFGPERAS
jgi:hypothetical protein